MRTTLWLICFWLWAILVEMIKYFKVRDLTQGFYIIGGFIFFMIAGIALLRDYFKNERYKL